MTALKSNESHIEEKRKNAMDYIDIAAKLSPALFLLVYLFGFLITSAHFSKFGIPLEGIIDSQYVVPGALFSFYLLIYCALVVPAAISLDRKGDKKIYLEKSNREDLLLWSSIAFKRLSNLAFLHCLAANVFCVIVHASSFNVVAILIAAVILFIVKVLDFFDSSNESININLSRGLLLTAATIGFTCFAFSPENSFTLHSLGIMAGNSFMLITILARGEKHEYSPTYLLFSGICFFIILLVNSLYFGSYMYDSIDRKMGGGKAVPVYLEVKPDSIGRLHNKYNELLHGELIYANEHTTFISIDFRTIAIPNESILWTQFGLAYLTIGRTRPPKVINH